MESPFDIIKNIGKNIVKTGKQAVTNLYDNGFIGISGIKTQGGLVPNFPQIFNPSSKLGIAENTIKGFPQAALTVGTTLKKAPGVVKDMMFPPRPFDEQVVSPMDYMTRSLRSPEEASMIEQKYKAQQPTVKEKLLALPKWGAEIGSGIGNLVGPALADKPLFTKDSFLGRIGVPGAGKTLTEVANTRFGGKLASGGGAVEDFAVPKNIRENVAMRGADLATALPVGAAKAVQSFKKVAELIAKSTDAKVIANELKNVGIADAVIPRISSSLAKETNPKVVEKVIQKMDNLYRGVAPEVAKTISPDDIKVMKLFINDIRQAKDVPFEGQRIISKDGKYAYDLMEKWNINTEQDANKIATIFEDILTGNRKVTATLLAKPKPIDDIIFQAKAIVKDGKKVVTEKPSVSEPDDLTKYKTLEEFVKAKGEKVFSGAGEEVKVWNESASRGGGTVYRGLNEWGDGIYVTDSPNYAKTYGTKTTESIVKPNLKLFDVRDSANISEIQKTKIISAFKEQYGKSLKSGFTQDITKALKEADNPKEFFDVLQNEVGTYTTDVLKKAGFDGIIANESKMNGGNIVGGKVYNIFDPKNIQTKSQLTDIWNKANKTKQPRDTIGRFDVKPKPTLSEELMAKMSKPKPVVPVYQGEKDLTVKTLEKLKGRSTVSKQFISDLTNSADLKQSERDLIREALANEGDTVNVADFAKKVKDETLPLKTKSSDLYTPEGKGKNSFKMLEEGDFTPKYEGVSLPDDIRGKVGNYRENIYESPIATSAGDVHFNYHTKNYFGHTRIEDMADNKIRRVIEVQSDLYQKGNLEKELGIENSISGQKMSMEKVKELYPKKYAEIQSKQKLQQYNDPTAHFRMVREEVKKAAQDGKTKLQFPTGETAMKIEGLGNNQRWFETIGGSTSRPPVTTENLKVGKVVNNGEDWVVTQILGDGKFVAVQKNTLDRLELQHGKIKDLSKIVGGATETFDISGKVDTNNPIYKFYEKEVGRYLSNKYKAKLVTDSQGVKWWEVDINPAMGKAPVEAFGAVAGVEVDEDGKVSFDPIKAGLGFAGFTAYNKGKGLIGKGKPTTGVNKIEQLLSQKGKGDLKPVTIAQKASSYIDDIAKLADGQINVDKLNISDRGKNLVTKVIDEVKPTIEESVGKTLSNKEAIDLASKSSDMIKRAVSRETTLEWESAMLRTRQKLAQAAETGKVDKEFIDNLVTIKSVGTDIGRKLQSLSIGADPKDITSMQAIIEAVLKVTDNADDILKKAKDVDFTNLKQATDFYRQFITPKTTEWIDLLRYNSMLSSPNTHIINTFSNLANTSIIAPIEKAVTGGLDFLSSKLTGEARRYFAGEGLVYAKDYLSNVGKAFDNFTGVMKGTRRYTNLDIKHLPIATSGVKGKVVSTLSIPMRLLEATDQFFSTLAEGAQLGALNYRKSKGVKVGNIETLAFDDAQYRLFRQPLNSKNQGQVLDAVDAVTGKIQDLRNSSNPIVSTVAKFTVPFLQTPMNIFKQGIEYSPVGFSTLIGANDKTEQLSKAIIGSTVFAGAATLLMSNRLTWGEPINEDQRNAFRAAGKLPYSIKIGDKWVSYQKLPPALAFPFAMVASIDDAIKNKKLDQSTADIMLGTVAKYGQFLADQSYFKSIGDLLGAFKGGESAIAKVVSNYPQQLVPMKSFLGWFARMFDGVQRKADKDAGFIEKQAQLLMMSIPGLSVKVPERTDAQGNPIKQPDRFLNLFSPVKVSTENKEKAQQFEQMQQLTKVKSELTEISAQEKAKVQPIYEEAQRLKASGDIEAGQALVNGLTDQEFEVYKKIKSSVQTKEKQQLRAKILPTYNDIQKLKKEGKIKEGRAMVKALTDDEYEAYLSVKKDFEKLDKVKPTEYNQNIIFRYAKAVTKDPSNALKALFTKEKLGNVEGNLVELQRFYGIPFTDVGGSQEYKKKRMTEMGLDWDTEQKNYKLEHIVPVSAGGSNADSNLVPINNVEHNIYTPVDIALGEAVKQGKITRKRATELARGLKVTKILSIDDIIKLLE